jgi:hypothetical protein
MVSFQWRVTSISGGGACSIGMSNDGGARIDNTIYDFNTASTWLTLSKEVTNDDAFVKLITIDVVCASGTSATVNIDQVKFAPKMYTPPKIEPTDVARNGNFESGSPYWSFDGQASVAIEEPQYGQRYLWLQSGGKASQQLVMPARALYDGYYGYDVSLKWRARDFANTGNSNGKCHLYFSQDGGWTRTPIMEYAFGNAFNGWIDFSGPIESEDGGLIKVITIGLECDYATTATVFVDQVQFKPHKELFSAARNGRFEAADLTPWVASGTTLSNADKTANDGLHYAQLSASSSDSGAVMSQEIVLPARYPLDGSDGYSKYDVKLSYKIVSYNGGTATGGAAACSFAMSWNSNAVSSPTTMNFNMNQAWSTYTRTISDVSKISKINFFFTCSTAGSSATMLIDSVKFVPVKNCPVRRDGNSLEARC